MFCKTKISIVVLLLINLAIGFAQSITNEKQLQEKVILTTDRTLYFAGEQIWLKANCLLPGINDSLSKVMYVELLDRKSKPIIQKKLQIVNGNSSGNIDLPADLLTGNYYIRAYTQYMRNFDRVAFYTTELTIINSDLPSKEIIQTIVKDTSPVLKDSAQVIAIHTTASSFLPNSLIDVELTGAKNSSLSVSIVKKGSYEVQAVGINNYYKPSLPGELSSKLKWYPEIRSVSISGKVVDKESEQPLKNVLVFASIIDSSKQFHITRTNADGAFVFSLTHLHDNHQVYICSEQGTVLINHDFVPGLPAGDYVTAKIDSAKKSLINEMYTNHQVTEIYNNTVDVVKTYLDTLPDPFQKSSEIIYFKDYVALPTMTEMFKEIVPYTRVKNNKSGISIQLVDEKTKITFEQPIVLLDHIPFHDHAALLSIPPSKINSVGIIATDYVYGNEVIGGVIDIKSKDDNLAGLPLPKDVVVADYIAYDPSTVAQFGKSMDFSVDKPGMRNTLYWNPNVVLNEGKLTIQFYLGNDQSKYDIVVRGVDEKGNAFTTIKAIEVGSKVN